MMIHQAEWGVKRVLRFVEKSSKCQSAQYWMECSSLSTSRKRSTFSQQLLWMNAWQLCHGQIVDSEKCLADMGILTNTSLIYCLNTFAMAFYSILLLDHVFNPGSFKLIISWKSNFFSYLWYWSIPYSQNAFVDLLEYHNTGLLFYWLAVYVVMENVKWLHFSYFKVFLSNSVFRQNSLRISFVCKVTVQKTES